MGRATTKRAALLAAMALAGCASNPPAPRDGEAPLDAALADAARADAADGAPDDTPAPQDAPAGDDAVPPPPDAASDAAPALGWRTEPALPMPRQEIATAVVDGRIYVVGGFEAGRITRTVRVFDPATSRWSTAPELPTERHHIALAAVGGDLYSLGGLLTLAFTPDATSYVLRRGATAWTPIAPMPAPRGSATAGVIGGRIIVAGGLGERGSLMLPTAIYDPGMNAWRAGAAMPTPREHVAGFVLGGRLYVAGGRRVSLDTAVDVVESYDPVMDAWRPEPSLMARHAGFAADVLDGVPYVVGGELPDRVLDTVERLDVAAGRWVLAPPTPTPHHGHGVSAVMGRLYVIGGGNRPTFAAVPVVESYAP